MQKYRKNKVSLLRGFTLVELLVVISIISVLATVMIASFRSSQARGRDTQRKSDLKQISNALELYYSDYNKYPASTPPQGLSWGSELTDGKTIYFKVLPKDPIEAQNYFYRVDTDRQKFQLYAHLENKEDINCIEGNCVNPSIPGGVSCGAKACNFSITSTNTTPTEQ